MQPKAKQIREIKRLVKLVEAETGKKVQFQEKKLLKENAIDDIVHSLNDINTFILDWQDRYNTYSESGFFGKAIETTAKPIVNKFFDNLIKKLNVVTQKATELPDEDEQQMYDQFEDRDDLEDERGDLEEEVDMDVEDALKDPQTLKKVLDKNIDVTLVDDEDLDRSKAVTIK